MNIHRLQKAKKILQIGNTVSTSGKYREGKPGFAINQFFNDMCIMIEKMLLLNRICRKIIAACFQFI